MSISFYDAGIGSYTQVLASVANVMDKGAQFAAESGLDPQEIVEKRLREDMMPFHFQIVSVCHHSWGAVQGMQAGRFSPPSFDLDKSYEELQGLVAEAQTGIASITESDAEAMADGKLVFALGNNELPFTNENFLLTFSLPNFYFHATTAYDILRTMGTPLGKMDFLGQMKIG